MAERCAVTARGGSGKARVSLHVDLAGAAATLAGDAHEYPNGQPAGKHERPAIAEEWQRNSSDRHEVDGHADVLEHVHQPTGEQSERDETTERVIRSLSDSHHSQKEREKEHDAECDADESTLLADDSPNEIRVLRWEECEALLWAVEISLAEPAAGANGYLRLNDVITRPSWIDRWVEKDAQSVLLVWREPLPENRREDAREHIRCGEDDALHQLRLVPDQERDEQTEPGCPDARAEGEDEAHHWACD